MTHDTERLPFALPDIGEAEIDAVVQTMRSGWLTTGPNTVEFEKEFAAALGEGLIAVSVNSATAGLHLALEAIGITAGDEVLVPTWTFTATAEVVRYLGATPILVDIVPETLNIDFADAATKVTPRTKAIMPVHMAGNAVAYSELDAFAAQHNLLVVEDAAHAFPCTSDGVRVGSGASIVTVFSFYATKTITTGEGGMLVTRDEKIAQRIRTMRLHGISRDIFNRYSSPGSGWHYDVVAPGYKYNLTDTASAMGRVQLARADEMRGNREVIAEAYFEGLQGLPLELPARGRAGEIHSWHLFIVRISADAPVTRDEFIAAMAEAGVGTSVHFIPLHIHPYWRDLGNYALSDFPAASRVFDQVVSLPVFSGMTEAQVQRVISTARQILGGTV